jgi:hypothetical protein
LIGVGVVWCGVKLIRTQFEKVRGEKGAYLSLHVGHLLLRELVLVELDAGRLEVFEIAQLAGEDKEERSALLAGSRRTTDSVDVFLWAPLVSRGEARTH